MDKIIFKVVKEFSRTPSARIAKEGRYPGTDLRNKITPPSPSENGRFGVYHIG